MKILVINAHWNNRGDEAAVRAMIDELLMKYPTAEITVQLSTSEIKQFRYEDDDRVKAITVRFPRKRNLIELPLVWLTRGRISLMKETREFIRLVKKYDIVVHAPGGPSIGETYAECEFFYTAKLLTIKALSVPYCFYAPSMGPFKNKIRNILRRYLYNHAEFICTREPISAEYAEGLRLKKDVVVTMDSAFQHDIDRVKYEEQFEGYTELKNFLGKYEKVVGLTLTELGWHPVHGKNGAYAEVIKNSFERFIATLKQEGYGVLFIPQLFGVQDDYELMRKYAKENCFVMSDDYDCYFQQYVIEKLYAVVGMRYHSNIFSAKMSTPFISIAYEQKMSGFMKRADLEKYCLSLKDLSYDSLMEKFRIMESEHDSYKAELIKKHDEFKKASFETTEILCRTIDRLGLTK